MIDLGIDISDALVADLNANLDVQGTPFVAERKWLPEYDASTMDRAIVCVVPRGFESSLASRAMENGVVMIDVAVMRRVDVLKVEESDQVARLAELVKEFTKGKTYVGATRVMVQAQNFVNPTHFREHNVFQLVMTFLFKITR